MKAFYLVMWRYFPLVSGSPRREPYKIILKSVLFDALTPIMHLIERCAGLGEMLTCDNGVVLNFEILSEKLFLMTVGNIWTVWNRTQPPISCHTTSKR